jgi:hypothetical protein
MNTKYLAVSIAVILGFMACLPKAEAVVPPPPGGYPNFTTAAGDHALQALTLGVGNTALGTFSLFSVTTGNFNTAVGAGALDLNTADSNTATGAAALLFNTTGTNNTANGTAALEFNETGGQNTANGAFALFSNTSGGTNTATGAGALFANTTGSLNTAIGQGALDSNTSADRNTAVGALALNDDTTGDRNTAIGVFALTQDTTGSFNTAVGVQAFDQLTTGGTNTALGVGAGGSVTTANNVICIGANVSGANVSNTCFIGNIRGVTTINANALPVVIDAANQLGTMSSSARFKKEIKPMASASEAILALNPVTFHYKGDKTGTPQFGLIAEEVAAVNPNLVVRDENGEVYTVRYDAVNAMLLNEFLKEHKKTEKLEAAVASLVATVNEQAAQIQRVSAQLEASKPAPQMVKNTD